MASTDTLAPKTDDSTNDTQTSPQRPLKILVTGGGTAGHISPALAIIAALKELRGDIEFLYVGSHGGIERSQVESAQVPFEAISTGKLRRYISVKNLADQFRVPVGIGQSLKIVRRFKPDVVLATGGYVAVPPVIAAGMLKVPILIHEQTTQVGLANKINARFASSIALSWESARRYLKPEQKKLAWVSGNPVRSSIFGGNAEHARKHFGLDDSTLPVIYITGGSQGASIINRAIAEVLPQLVERALIIHQCGQQPADMEQDFDILTRARLMLPEKLQKRYAVARFIKDELRDVFALCDLVVGRAGAGTVTEICALGLPALYVPLVPTGGDEQTKNAKMCADIDAARMVAQEGLNGEKLLAAILDLLQDGTHLKKMGENAKTLAKPAAARDLARAV